MVSIFNVVDEIFPGRKEDTQHISIFACSNDDRSEKFELTIIGQATKSKLISKCTVFKPNFDSLLNWKLWITITYLFSIG